MARTKGGNVYPNKSAQRNGTTSLQSSISSSNHQTNSSGEVVTQQRRVEADESNTNDIPSPSSRTGNSSTPLSLLSSSQKRPDPLDNHNKSAISPITDLNAGRSTQSSQHTASNTAITDTSTCAVAASQSQRSQSNHHFQTEVSQNTKSGTLSSSPPSSHVRTGQSNYRSQHGRERKNQNPGTNNRSDFGTEGQLSHSVKARFSHEQRAPHRDFGNHYGSHDPYNRNNPRRLEGNRYFANDRRSYYSDWDRKDSGRRDQRWHHDRDHRRGWGSLEHGGDIAHDNKRGREGPTHYGRDWNNSSRDRGRYSHNSSLGDQGCYFSRNNHRQPGNHNGDGNGGDRFNASIRCDSSNGSRCEPHNKRNKHIHSHSSEHELGPESSFPNSVQRRVEVGTRVDHAIIGGATHRNHEDLMEVDQLKSKLEVSEIKNKLLEQSVEIVNLKQQLREAKHETVGDQSHPLLSDKPEARAVAGINFLAPKHIQTQHQGSKVGPSKAAVAASNHQETNTASSIVNDNGTPNSPKANERSTAESEVARSTSVPVPSLISQKGESHSTSFNNLDNKCLSKEIQCNSKEDKVVDSSTFGGSPPQWHDLAEAHLTAYFAPKIIDHSSVGGGKFLVRWERQENGPKHKKKSRKKTKHGVLSWISHNEFLFPLIAQKYLSHKLALRVKKTDSDTKKFLVWMKKFKQKEEEILSLVGISDEYNCEPIEVDFCCFLCRCPQKHPMKGVIRECDYGLKFHRGCCHGHETMKSFEDFISPVGKMQMKMLGVNDAKEDVLQQTHNEEANVPSPENSVGSLLESKPCGVSVEDCNHVSFFRRVQNGTVREGVVVSINAGVGSVSVLLKQLNLSVLRVIHVEQDRIAQHVYRSNHDSDYNEGGFDDGIQHVVGLYETLDDLLEDPCDLVQKFGPIDIVFGSDTNSTEQGCCRQFFELVKVLEESQQRPLFYLLESSVETLEMMSEIGIEDFSCCTCESSVDNSNEKQVFICNWPISSLKLQLNDLGSFLSKIRVSERERASKLHRYELQECVVGLPKGYVLQPVSALFKVLLEALTVGIDETKYDDEKLGEWRKEIHPKFWNFLDLGPRGYGVGLANDNEFGLDNLLLFLKNLDSKSLSALDYSKCLLARTISSRWLFFLVQPLKEYFYDKDYGSTWDALPFPDCEVVPEDTQQTQDRASPKNVKTESIREKSNNSYSERDMSLEGAESEQNEAAITANDSPKLQSHISGTGSSFHDINESDKQGIMRNAVKQEDQVFVKEEPSTDEGSYCEDEEKELFKEIEKNL